MMKRLRLLVVDGHELARRGIRELLSGNREVVIAGEAMDGPSAVAAAQRLRPDLMILDLDLRGLSGLQVIDRLRTALPATRLLVFTARDEEVCFRSAFLAGVTGYALKQSPATTLGEAVEAVARGGTFVDPLLPCLQWRSTRRLTSTDLSEREREVIASVARGYSHKEIAAKLGVSVKTVETYRSRGADKLGVRSRADLVRYALDRGWITPQPEVAYTP